MGPLFAVLITLVPIPLSVWWLRRFQFGPLEWLWRSLTYGQRQPMLIEPSARSTARVFYLRPVVAGIVVLTAGMGVAVWEPAERRRSDEAEIARLEAEWRSALLGADTKALGDIAWGNYRVQRGNHLGVSNLRQLVESIESRRLRFDSFSPHRVTVRAHEYTGSASGLETQLVSSGGNSVGGVRRYVHWLRETGRPLATGLFLCCSGLLSDIKGGSRS